MDLQNVRGNSYPLFPGTYSPVLCLLLDVRQVQLSRDVDVTEGFDRRACISDDILHRKKCVQNVERDARHSEEVSENKADQIEILVDDFMYHSRKKSGWCGTDVDVLLSSIVRCYSKKYNARVGW